MKKFAIVSGFKVINIVETEEEEFSLDGFTTVDITNMENISIGNYIMNNTIEEPAPYDIFYNAMLNSTEEVVVE